MTKPIQEQVIVIVGASSGIGRATALLAGRLGARVTVAARSREPLSTLVGEIEQAGGQAAAVPTDVADAPAVYRLADEAERRFGGIDTWVNMAAVSVYAPVEETTDEEFDRIMRVNFLGHVYGVHAALPALRRNGGGTIIGISSVEAIRALPLHGAYSASKAAVRNFYDSLRMELMEQGSPVEVTTVLPASVDTPLFEHSRSKLGATPKPPPPVYAPEVVARAVVRAAERPVREIVVGGSALGFISGQCFAPGLTDALMALPRLGFASQQSGRPDDGTDNLDAPLGDGRVHGEVPGRVLRRSLFTTALGQRRRPGDAVRSVVKTRRRRAQPA